MGVLSHLMPARKKEFESTKVVADLDKMVAQRVAFKWNGRTHFINPISTESYLKFVDASANITKCFQQIQDGVPINKHDLYKQYGEIFHLVCETISVEQVYDMTQHQVAALMGLITECVSGKIFVKEEEEKKKIAQADLT